MTSNWTDRHSRGALLIGALLGIGVAATGALRPRPAADPLPPGAIARVNDQPITRADFDDAVGQLPDSRGPDALSDAERQAVVDQLIDEELLVQRAIEIGVVRTDHATRQSLVRAMLQSVALAADTRPPSDEDLRAEFAANPAAWQQPARLRVARAWFAATPERPDPRARADRAFAHLTRDGLGISELTELTDPDPRPLPDRLATAVELTRVVGRPALNELRELAVGATIPPLPFGTGFQILQLLERAEPEQPAFAEVVDQMRATYAQRDLSQARRAYCQTLRNAASITVAPPAPTP